MMFRFGISACVAAGMAALSMEAANAPLSREAKDRLRAERRARQLAESGGIVERRTSGKCALIASAQGRVGIKTLEKVAESVRSLVQIRVDIAEADGGASLRPTAEHPVVVSIVDDSGSDATLLVAPEQNWAVVNLHMLAKDNPSAEVLDARVHKETWRALAMAMGAANSMAQPCLMREINSLYQLDHTRNMLPSPQPIRNMMEVADRLGIPRIRRATYRTACLEGWAPPPTNDVQKAIWEKVHSEKERGPAKALKIVP